MTLSIDKDELKKIIRNSIGIMCKDVQHGDTTGCAAQADTGFAFFEAKSVNKLKGVKGNYVFEATPQELDQLVEMTVDKICGSVAKKPSECKAAKKKTVETVRRTSPRLAEKKAAQRPTTPKPEQRPTSPKPASRPASPKVEDTKASPRSSVPVSFVRAQAPPPKKNILHKLGDAVNSAYEHVNMLNAVRAPQPPPPRYTSPKRVEAPIINHATGATHAPARAPPPRANIRRGLTDAINPANQKIWLNAVHS